MVGMIRILSAVITCICLVHVTVGQVNPQECRSLMDLFIVIDGSDSIAKDDFVKLKTAIEAIVNTTDLGKKKARIGMLVYSSHIPMRSKHIFSYDRNYLVHAARTLQHPRDGTKTSLGLEHMIAIFSQYGRANVPHVCITITDGISKNRTNTAYQAHVAASMGISMFAMGIGHKVNYEELKDIASSEQQITTIKNFGQLQNTLSSMMVTICPCPVPPILPNSDCDDGPRAIGTQRSYICKPGYMLVGNPTITCQGDFTWTAISPSFECVPCSAITPTVEYSRCLDGKHTIGTERTYKCLDGYRQVGFPHISCLPNATWSRPTIKCLPCGEPMAPMFGVCENGDITIGTKRTLRCIDPAGYRAIGNPSIECVDDPNEPTPNWKYNGFKCLPCDEPIPPIHADCDVGASTIGATRSLQCQPGYQPFGNNIIQCIDDDINRPRPYWQMNDFRCRPPCGEPMAPMFGVCEDGGLTIGSKRTLRCIDPAGYRAIGNPSIECVDDPNQPTPYWKYNGFECLPCDEPKPPIHADCDVGASTIGATRSLQCKPGYQPFGNNIIQCIDDDINRPRPYWQLNDFRCRPPCGEPNLPPYASCAEGAYTIGSTRAMQCLDVGYKAKGEPIMECVDDLKFPEPYWVSNFECVPCGEPIAPEHALFGKGHYTIASTRTLACKTGYKGIGLAIMQCVNDPHVAEPYWAYEFRCEPCGVPEAPINAVCEDSPITLVGSERALHCKAGYKPIGTPSMQCIADDSFDKPYWSYNFECVPCGEPMAPMFGVCEDGGLTIGSKRTLRCIDPAGYRAIGNPSIECVDDPNQPTPYWKYNGFECLPCDEPKPPIHADCDVGASTIGATRSLQCKPGYQPFGNNIIQCIDDDINRPRPYWQLNDFRCRPPCGEPNLPPYASCAEGAYTIGSTRAMQCLDVGYKAKGEPIMECVDDLKFPEPYWVSNFECVPCGEPIAPEHALYGKGHYTIASTRTLACKTGYKGIGLAIMQCVNDPHVAEPYWAYEFRCEPCGVPEAPINAVCEDSPITLVGSERALHCKAGYKPIGTPSMQCIADDSFDKPYWSYNFECVPCGEPMAPMFGVCEDGGLTIGSKRTLRCIDPAGYRAIGNPSIECVDDPNQPTPYWKYNGFECLPCDEPKPPIHADCDVGASTIGATRSLQCKPGYQPFGNNIIQCIDDDINRPRPYWQLNDFRCRPPCGEPTPPIHADCGVGDYLIGSTRTLHCKPGYMTIGDPFIQCVDDPNLAPYWKHNFKCVACGDTPTIPHGSCGGGPSTIDSVRELSCDVDYHPVGIPQIQCMSIPGYDTPVWTPDFDFRCIQCNNPPYIENAYSNDGPNTVGTVREYHCYTGYTVQGPGTGQLECNGNGEWVGPAFTCEAVVITTPIPTSPDPTLCDSCRYLNGVGFNRHPTDCSQYVQCYIGNKGLEPVYRPCPYGEFWDHDDLTCKRSQDVYCPYDKCANDPGVASYKHSDPNNCCAYWECNNGRSFGKCCPEGETYSTKEQRCVSDPTCVNSCLKDIQIEPRACSSKPNETNDDRYLQHIGNGYYVNMPCAPGTVYEATQCGCIASLKALPGGPIGCVPEIDLSFAGGRFIDKSRNRAAVSSQGVTIYDNAAFFDGSSRLSFNYFSNNDFSEELVIKFRYLETENYELQALLTNSDCGDDPSVIIAKMEGHVLMGAKSEYSTSFAIPTQDHRWKEVIYHKSEKLLEGMVCGGSYKDALYGRIQKNKCSLHLGYGTGLRNFRGYIKDFQVFRCRPNDMYAFYD